MAAATSVVVLDRGNNTTCTVNLHGKLKRRRRRKEFSALDFDNLAYLSELLFRALSTRVRAKWKCNLYLKRRDLITRGTNQLLPVALVTLVIIANLFPQ